MAWFKRNLVLVIGGVVTLLLLGAAGWYSYSQYTADATVAENLAAAAASYKELNSKPLLPGDAKVNNIALATNEYARLKGFADSLKGYLAAGDLPKDLDNKTFRALLDKSITEMQLDAQRNNVTLPITNYWFTFQNQRSSVEFKGLEALASQLGDIKAISSILINARVQSIVYLKRPRASDDDSGYSDYVDRKAQTNDWAVVTPYEITFQGFSGDLARVSAGLANAKQCFIIRTVAVDKAPVAPTPSSAPPMNPAMMQMTSRYGAGYGGRSFGGPQAMPIAPQPARGLNTLLDENKLRFTLQLDSVRVRGKK